MARPVCKGRLEIILFSLRQHVRSRGRCPGQDGDLRSLVLIITAVSMDRSPADDLLFLCRRDRRIEALLLSQHRPGDAGQLGRQRHHGDGLVRPLQQAANPAAERPIDLDNMTGTEYKGPGDGMRGNQSDNIDLQTSTE